MQELLLNDELYLTYPAGFRRMTAEELGKLQMLAAGEGVALTDPERHMIVTVGWKQPGMLTNMLLSVKDLAKNMERQIRKPMEEFGYRLESRQERDIAGLPARGICYTYRVQGTDMYAESWVCRNKRTVYWFHVYARNELREESLPVWSEILGLTRAK